MKFKVFIALLYVSCSCFASYRSDLRMQLEMYRYNQKSQCIYDGYLAAGEMLREMEVLPIEFTKDQFQEWFEKQFIHARRSVYFRYPSIRMETVRELCAFADYNKLPTPTKIDIKYSAFIKWKKNLSPYSLDAQLALEIDEVFFEQGSRGDFKTIQSAIRSVIDSSDCHLETALALEKVAGMEGYHQLNEQLSSLRGWQNRLDVNPHSPLYALSERMANEMEAILLYGGGSDEFDAWVLSTFGGSESPYFQYPGITQPELTNLFAFSGLPKPVGPSQLDLIKQEVVVFLTRTQIHDADKQLFESLLQEIDHQRSLPDLQSWYDLTYVQADHNIYLDYPGLSHHAAQHFASILQVDTPREPEKTVSDPPPAPYSPPCKVGPNSRIALLHRAGDGVGYSKGYSTAAVFLTPNWNRNFQPFLNVQGHIFNNGKWATNLGIGSRWRVGESPWVLGGNFYYDWRQITNAFSPHQMGVGAEVLNPYLDLRVNGYIPIGTTSKAQQGVFDTFSGHNVFCTNDAFAALSTIQAEVGSYLPGWFRYFDMYAAIGPYYLFERNVAGVTLGNALGVKARLSAKLYDGIEAGFDITYDDIFNTRPQGYIALSLPLGPTNLRSEGSRWSKRYPSQHCDGEALIQRRLTQDVERNEIIPVQKAKRRFIGIDPRTGDPLFFVFVNNTSSSNGTFESPYPTTALAQANSNPNDVIYVFPGDGTTTGYATTLTLQSGQILQSATKKFDFLGMTIPAQTKGNNPQLTSGAGDAIVLANNTIVNGFTITGASTDGIDASSATNFTVLNNIITANADNGLDATGGPAGLKAIINNHFLGDNTSGAPANSEILASLASGTTLAIVQNRIDPALMATFGVNVTDINENCGLLVRDNHICNYIGGGFLTSGAASITSTPTGSIPAKISLIGNSLQGLTSGAYAVVASSGNNIIQINKNGFDSHSFFHTFVSITSPDRTILQTNDNNYGNSGIAFGQSVLHGGAAGQLCQQVKGNISAPTDGLLFSNGTGMADLFQIESSTGTAAGVQAANEGEATFAGTFNFVPPGTACP